MAALTSALIMGGAALAGAAVNASAANKAVKTSTAAAERASAEAMQAAIAAGKSQVEAAQIAADAAKATAEGNNALLKSIYDQNKMVLQPSMQTGQGAQDAINAFLGLPVYKQEKNYTGYVDDNPDILANFEKYGEQFGGDKAAFGKWFNDQYGDMNPAEVQMGQVEDTEAPQRQADAFARFREGTGYQAQLQQGIDALDQSAAAKGMLNSGKAAKSVIKYGSDLAGQSAGQYLNYLSNQQGVGSSAINALTGLSSNYGQQVAANNSNATATANSAMLGANAGANNALLNATGTAGALQTGAANTAAQGTLANANNVSNLLGQAVSAYGSYAGTSSYAQPAKTAQYGSSQYAPVYNDQYAGQY